MGAEENYSKVLVTGIPEVANGMLVHDGEDALAVVSKVFIELGSFELARNRLFNAALQRLSTSTDCFCTTPSCKLCSESSTQKV